MSKLHTFLSVLKAIAGPILQLSGVPPQLAPLVQHGIELAESHPGTGAEKKAIALDAVATGVAGVNAVKPGTIDGAAVTAVVDQGIDMVVGTVNLLTKHGS